MAHSRELSDLFFAFFNEEAPEYSFYERHRNTENVSQGVYQHPEPGIKLISEGINIGISLATTIETCQPSYYITLSYVFVSISIITTDNENSVRAHLNNSL